MSSSDDRLAQLRDRLLITLDFAKAAGLSAELADSIRQKVERAFSERKPRAMADCAEFVDDLQFSATERVQLAERLRDAGIPASSPDVGRSERIAQRVLDRGHIKTLKEYRTVLECVDVWVQDQLRGSEVGRLNEMLAKFEIERAGPP